jgi:CDP-diacylglycerol--glycerol-3-phosphate 3-phosphatidyltransferase
MPEKEKIVNVPNALSVYRMLALPFIVYTIVTGNKQLYITLLSINLITDILDGLIARTFKLETELGARLDSFADLGTYVMAFSGMIILEREFVSEHAVAFSIIIGMYALPQLISLVRFHRPTSFHLYSSKTLGYIQGIFIFTYFVFGYNAWYFYFMAVSSILVYTEALIIVISIPVLRSNVRGIYFMLREHKRIV